MSVDLRLGDCREVLRDLPPDSVDACVTDPPYGMSADPDMAEVLRHWLAGDAYEHGGGGFMGKTWDSFVPGPDYWREVYRVLRPGAHLLAFAATRTMDLMSVAIRLAGFQCRDTISGEVPLRWVYGSGFPKSLDVSKAIDAAAGAVREVIRINPCARPIDGRGGGYSGPTGHDPYITAPATPDVARWQGWGTALKPAWEPVLVFRKPLSGTVAANVLRYGTGGINVDGCRVGTDEDRARPPRTPNAIYGGGRGASVAPSESHHLGRWPANLTLTHDEDCTPAKCADGCPVAVMDGQSGVLTSGEMHGSYLGGGTQVAYSPYGYARRDVEANSGGASRFFYCAKPSRMERDLGCDGLAVQSGGAATARTEGSDGLNSPRAGAGRGGGARNVHPTVKPVDLMRWLVRLVTPPGGTVLDPFLGSGTTGCAATFEGFNFIGIEGGCDESPKYLDIARHRIEFWDKCGRNGVDPREAERGPEPAPGQVSLFGGGH